MIEIKIASIQHNLQVTDNIHYENAFLKPSVIASTNSLVKCKKVVISPVIFLISKI